MIPVWKRWLSYLTEVHIESAPSDINPHLYVSMKKGKLQLCTENAIYSYDENYHNFSGTFSQIQINNLKQQDVLIMGFGLGSIPMMLEHDFGLDVYYTGIELDENVLYLFEQYNAERVSSSLQLICADARIYAATCQQQYRMICSDVFLDNTIPSALLELSYLEDLARILEVDGLLVMNTLASTIAQQKAASAYFEQIFQQVFPNAIKLEVHHNYMLLSNKDWLK